MRNLLALLLFLPSLCHAQTGLFIGEAFLTYESCFSSAEITGCTIGESYILRTTGLYTVWGGSCDQGDAAFEALNLETPTPYSPWVWNDICDGCQNNRPTPDLFNPEHVYEFPFIAESETQTFHFQDSGGCGNNCGGIQFEIYEVDPPAIPAHVPIEGLIAWYPLDQSLEDVHGGHDGFGSSPSFEVDGGILLQSGDAPVELPSSLVVNDMGGGLTMGGWIRQDATEMVWRVAIDLTNGNSNNAWSDRATLSAAQVDGVMRWSTGFHTGDDMANNVSRVLSLPDPDMVGVWRHVMAVWDVNDVVKIYVNGAPLDGSLDISDATDFDLTGGNTGSRRIGGRAHNSDPNRLWHGAMKDIGIWGRALTSEEIQTLFLGEPLTYGCTDPDACNFQEEANADDGSCLTPTDINLNNQLSVDDAGQIVLNAPEGLTAFTWNDGSSAQQIQVGSGGEFILNAQIGEVPQIGDLIDNGLVFHIDTLLQEVYIATPTQIGGGAEYGCYGTETGASGTQIGDGINNTLAILAACDDPTSAASVASAVGDGWFLPSRDELDAIRTQLHETGIGTYSMNNPITYNWYWPSTECEEDPGGGAGSMHFSDGFYGVCNNKNSNPGGVIAAKRINGEFCFTSDTLFIASSCNSAAPSSACGEGTVWDPVNEECIIAIPADLNYDGCVSVNDLLVLLAVHGTCPPLPEWPDEPTDNSWACGDPLTYWDCDYATVLIGDQCWFAENLKTAVYENGDAIAAGLTDGEWTSTTSGATSTYGEGSSTCYESSPDIDACDEAESLQTYGRLYNWYAVNDSRGLCPSDWHVPSDSEWTALVDHVGAQDFSGTEGTALKAESAWSSGGNGTNDFGFTALPGGHRFQGPPTAIDDGTFNVAGYAGYWWSTTALNNTAWRYAIYTNNTIVGREDDHLQFGFSVRCIKD